MSEKNTYQKLEKSLQNGAPKKHYDYDPDAWTSLEMMLEEDEKSNLLGLLPILISFLIIIGIGLIWVNQYKSESDTKSVTQNEIYLSVEKVISEANVSDNINGQISPLTQVNIDKTEINIQGTEVNKNTTNHINNQHLINKDSDQLDKSDSILSSQNSNTGSSREKEAKQVDELEKGLITLTSAKTQEVISERKMRSSINISSLEIANMSLEDGELRILNNDNIVPILTKPPVRVFSIVGGLESSRTPKGNHGQPDLNIGIKYAHTLSSKLSLTMGAQYVVSRYRAEKGEYKSTAKFFEDRGGDPEFTLANCTMADVSMGLSYHFNGMGKKGLVFHSSLVSNFMLDENYNYKYVDSGSDWSGSWFGANNTILSATEFAFNYKFAPNNSFGIELGPYAKIPLKGIGHGSLELTSYGLRVGVNFIKQ